MVRKLSPKIVNYAVFRKGPVHAPLHRDRRAADVDNHGQEDTTSKDMTTRHARKFCDNGGGM
jgi:hypothetical protein